MRSFFSATFLGVIYLAASLLIGEQHPFTLVPMYNSFQNYAYSFYLSDSTGTLIPFTRHFDCHNDYLSHIYGSVCDKNNIRHGNQIETDEQLKLIGKSMMEELNKHQRSLLPTGIIQLHRVCYFAQGGSMKENDKMMYEQTNY